MEIRRDFINTFNVKIDNNSISFDDDYISDDEPSSFSIVMDFIPVFYAYKYRENKEHVKEIEYLSDKLPIFNSFYTSLKKIELFNSSTDNKIYARYFEIVQKQSFQLYNKLKEIQEELPPPSSEADNFNEQNTFRNFLDLDFERDLYLAIESIKGADENFPDYSFFRSQINLFNNYLARRINRYGNQLKIRYILRNFIYYFLEKIEKTVLNDLNLYNDYKVVFSKSSSTLPIAKYNLHFKTLLFAQNVQIAHEISERKNDLAKAVLEIPNSLNGFTLIRDLDNAIYNHKIQGAKKYLSKKGCFAIMTDSNQNIYYAISGAKKNERKKETIRLCRQIVSILKRSNKAIQRCVVTKNMERYENMGIFITNDFKPIFYKDDLQLNRLNEGDYGCCERKILAYKGIPDSNNTFFIRWAPCEKCRPAIFGRYKQIFAFYEKSDVNHPYNASKLIEFKVRKKIDFDLNEIGTNTIV